MVHNYSFKPFQALFFRSLIPLRHLAHVHGCLSLPFIKRGRIFDSMRSGIRITEDGHDIYAGFQEDAHQIRPIHEACKLAPRDHILLLRSAQPVERLKITTKQNPTQTETGQLPSSRGLL